MHFCIISQWQRVPRGRKGRSRLTSVFSRKHKHTFLSSFLRTKSIHSSLGKNRLQHCKRVNKISRGRLGFGMRKEEGEQRWNTEFYLLHFKYFKTLKEDSFTPTTTHKPQEPTCTLTARYFLSKHQQKWFSLSGWQYKSCVSYCLPSSLCWRIRLLICNRVLQMQWLLECLTAEIIF